MNLKFIKANVLMNAHFLSLPLKEFSGLVGVGDPPNENI